MGRSAPSRLELATGQMGEFVCLFVYYEQDLSVCTHFPPRFPPSSSLRGRRLLGRPLLPQRLGRSLFGVLCGDGGSHGGF